MKTYLFDFDGTLVDSMPTYAALMLRILDENGIIVEKFPYAVTFEGDLKSVIDRALTD